jgi:5-methylcytosine-specific restriction endonuclease McrA
MIGWGLGGALVLMMGYGLINPAKSQYTKDIERHGYPRKPPNKVVHAVYLRDNGRCVNCGSTEDIHIDHIIPYSKGGSSTDPDNLQLLCGKCNLEKSDRI